MNDVNPRIEIPAPARELPDPAALETTNLGPTKRRIVERLKRSDAKVSDLAQVLDMTEAGVRQHLDALAEHGLVVSRPGSAEGRGRPPTMWALTDLAQDLFPDRHDDLTVELITAVRTALGDQGLARVIDARAEVQRAAYERAMPKRGALRARVEALANIRTAEGYVAEVLDDPDPDGNAVFLVEHHCPICTAASACPGLCGSELALFREVLGPKVTVERTQHIVSGDRRCTYRIEPGATPRGHDERKPALPRTVAPTSDD
jgi:predicted ArsR family transcriptional regulator